MSAVAGHHAMPAALLLPVVVGDFARVALMFELLQYYSSQEKYRDLCGSPIN